MLKNKNILFISPEFFNYHKYIKRKLESFGAKVDFFNERPTINSKTLNHFLNNIPKHIYSLFVKRYFDKMLKKNKEYDYLFLIRGEVIPEEFIKKLKNKHRNIKLIMYQWDSINNNPNVLNIIDYFDFVYSFDYKDSILNKTVKFRPLFFIDPYKNIKKRFTSIDVLFIGSYHSDRLKIIKEINNECERLNLSFYNHLYLPKISFLKKKYLEREFNDGFEWFNNNKLNEKQIINLISKSKIILDIQHPDQTGLTMRTIEAIGAKKKIITTNHNIKKYDFYNKNNINIIDRNNIQIKEQVLSSNYKELPKKIYKKYSLEFWLKEIFGTENGYG